jgi:hypothetical protein
MRKEVVAQTRGRVRLDDDTQWPYPDERFHEVAWRMRYGEPTQADRYYAASVMETYADLVVHPAASLRNTMPTLRRFWLSIRRKPDRSHRRTRTGHGADYGAATR